MMQLAAGLVMSENAATKTMRLQLCQKDFGVHCEVTSVGHWCPSDSGFILAKVGSGWGLGLKVEKIFFAYSFGNNEIISNATCMLTNLERWKV